MTIVEIKNLDFAYGGETVLEDVNLTVRQKDFIAIIGPNGGGKTTLLKLMLGLLKPVAGTIRVDGKSPQEASPCIGYVPQNVHTNSSFPITALDVVLMGKLDPKKRLSRRSVANRRDALAALERLEMAAYADKKSACFPEVNVSGCSSPERWCPVPSCFYWMNPPPASTPRGQADFYRLLKNSTEDITVLVVSHDLLAISRYVKSVACVNKKLHYHDQAEITGDMLETMYPCTVEEVCPVELVAHGLPHRVLADHEKEPR
jgi:zinc transport system ATP-binding protein